MCSVVEMVRRYISACSEWDLERVLRRSADGPEPGRGQGLGAPWTPPPIRYERSGREYRVSDVSLFNIA